MQSLQCCHHRRADSFDECRLIQWSTALWPCQITCQLTKAWAVTLPVACDRPHPSSPFIINTQSKTWYSFYRHVEGVRLSRPVHCAAVTVWSLVYNSAFRDIINTTAHGEIPTTYFTYRSQTCYQSTTPLDHSYNDNSEFTFHVFITSSLLLSARTFEPRVLD